ncbi:aminoglycoside phosphotransferase [Streptomyces sp. NPDC092307]|uniref:aminoglycoside phosphotransferase n=1 Tax=Streptomyces sp. NPDC092307 TaxID=3366013 RepID=UPI0038047A96
MSTTLLGLARLPASARAAVEQHTGPLLDITEFSEVFHGEISAHCVSRIGAWHLKGLRTDHPQAPALRREAEIAPSLAGVAPALRWRVHSSGWDLLGFEALEGRPADYSPGSRDLSEVVSLLCRVGAVAGPDLGLRTAEQRLARYASRPEHLGFFVGDHLVHTDLNHTNLLVDRGAKQGDRARLVDWAWATRGAAWLDAGCWVVWLIASGHSPASAERWAAKVPAWRTASAQGITAFAAAGQNVWEEIASVDPDLWAIRMTTAAAAWHAYRNKQY